MAFDHQSDNESIHTNSAVLGEDIDQLDSQDESTHKVVDPAQDDGEQESIHSDEICQTTHQSTFDAELDTRACGDTHRIITSDKAEVKSDHGVVESVDAHESIEKIQSTGSKESSCEAIVSTVSVFFFFFPKCRSPQDEADTQNIDV